MEFGDDIIRRCPDCNVIFAQHTYLSASTHGYVQWTDGCWTSHYLNISPLIVYCPFCKEWKPIDETEELFTLPIAADYGLMPVIELDDECTSDDYMNALKSPRCLKLEKELRMRLWWRFNDKRRRCSSEPDDLDLPGEFYDNLNKLFSLLGQDEEVLRAEIFRELGEFDKAMEILALEDSEGRPLSDSEPGQTILLNCEKENTLPVEAGARPSPVFDKQGMDEFITAPVCGMPADDSDRESNDHPAGAGLDLEKVIKQGFYPFPYPEDIFAFPLKAKDSEGAFLAVDLSKIKNDWTGWASFFPKEAEHRFKYGRLFNTDEWREFCRYPHEWQNELKKFWQYTSYTVAGDPGCLEEYCRIRWQFFYGYTEYIDMETIADRKELFNPFWHELKNELSEKDMELFSWLMENEKLCYWNCFWTEYTEEIPVLCAEDIERIQHKALEKEEYYLSERMEALEGLKYVELGGFPHWFQGCDKTPASLSGKQMDFVGQVWTDYVSSYSSVLVYLFYDHENGYLAQVYDYD